VAEDRPKKQWRGRRPKRKNCLFCVEKSKPIDFKDSLRLRRFVTDRGKILPRRVSGNCAKHQRVLAVAIKRSRELALLPYAGD
jgi:small subunit ribosomal protein S18